MILQLRDNSAEVMREFERYAKRVQNRRAANAQLAARMLEAIEDNFRAEGRPTRWAPLAASTLKQRRLGAKGAKILQASGKLAASITPFSDNNLAGVGTNKPYAPAQHFGTGPHEIKPKNKKALAFGGKVYRRVRHPGLKARPFMVLTDNDRADLIRIMQAHLTGNL